MADSEEPNETTEGEASPEDLADELSTNQDDADLAAEWAAALEESGDGDQADIDELMSQADGGDDSQPMVMDEFAGVESFGEGDEGPSLDVILDIPVIITMEVGGTEITIRNLLQLNQGSVIELDRLAGEPLDVKVNGTLIAHGEVVVVNEKFGIRLTDVISPTERIKKLR
ncbi:flagellar motor switch protein FliN [Spartinivicinus poritis]|uniref:Flagellar motor switch protein FliN n=1 Tax=Spartinivicinus poritis TaxID=2994640 RepID=A0ABT5U554_9GAMM|nr:flagellar motor switch protein FliN [Spartinivicinus sp. A2-2]MDE1461483.1 flagellar motor switch protein FliN [Spartinivicinus sp. A2-2]